MGNIESNPEGSLGAVDSLKHRLQSLEEAIRSIEVAHQDAQGDHFPAPDSSDVCLYGARLACRPGVRILTGPVIGEVTASSVVILLEVDIAPELGPTAKVSCYISLTDDACPRGRVVSTATLHLPSRRPRVFRFEGGPRNTLGPGRTYTVCFGGVGIEDARFRVGRFRTPNTCFGPGLKIIAVSGDRPARLPPGEPSLWRMLREHITAPSSEASPPPIDLVLHTGGQAWMGDAFEDARELLRRRAMEPLLCAEGGWREAQEEATECLREAVRRAWNLPDKRTVLSSVANLMLCGAADVHADLERSLASLPSSTMGHAGGAVNKKQSLEARALHAAVRACRRVYCEYQGQLLWKAVSSGEGRVEDTLNLTAAFEAEEKCVEEALAEAHRAGRDVAIKQKKVMIAEEALRRANSAGSLPAEGGRRAVEDTIEKFRKDVKAAQAKRMSLAKRPVPAGADAAAERASQGAFLDLGGSIGFILLDTTWTRVNWDGGMAQPQGDGGVSSEAAPAATSLLSHDAWETLEKRLSRDSELRLLIVLMRFALMGGGVEASNAEHPPSSNVGNVAPRDGNNLGGEPPGVGVMAQRGPSWLSDRDRLLNLLFRWKTAEAWREVVLVCGSETGCGGYGGLRSSCEVEITDTKNPRCTIRQLIAGPITDTPHPVANEKIGDGYPAPRPLFGATDDPGRFSCRLASIEDPATTSFARDQAFSIDATSGRFGGNGSSTMAVGAASTPPRQNLEVKAGRGNAAPGWDDGGAPVGSVGGIGSTHPDSTQNSHGTQPPGNAQAVAIPRQAKAVSADGERSFLQASLYAGHSPTTAIAAGLDPTTSARGLRASVVAEAVKLSIAGATVVLGPVVGRVTQRSAVVLLEAGSTAAVGCVLTDGVTGGQHRQTRLLVPGQPYAFFFETLEQHRHYTISLDGVDNADSRTGGFTTLKAWSDRREPPALRAALRLATASTATASSTGLSQPDQEREEGDPTSSPLPPPALPDRNKGGDVSVNGRSHIESSACDVRLLFVSGTGLATGRGARGTVAPPADMWRVLGRELWNPWPQADVVVHTGSQVDLEVAVLEALPLLSAAEAEEEGSDAREEAEEMAMERIRDAYRFQWSLPGARACLSCGSHVMLRGEADLALPQLDLERAYSSALRGEGGGRGGGKTVAEEGQQIPRGLHVSAYARLTLARLASQAFSDYQRQLWDPQSVPVGLDMNDIGYARGGSGVDSIRSGGHHASTLDIKAAEAAGMGEWHFHVFGETVGLFALDVRQGSAGLQDQRAPILSGAQWSSLALALSIEEIQAMIIVGDKPFVTDSIRGARAKARYPSNARLRLSWPFHGGELLRLLTMLVEWKATGAVGGEPREVTLIGGGLRYPLETVISDSLTSTAINQTICGPFSGVPSQNRVSFEFTGQLSQRLSYHHIASGALHEGQQQSSDQSAGPKHTQTPAALYDTSNTIDADDCGRRPSFVLVRCEASGAGPSARLLLRSCPFTPASWTAWCNGGFKETPLQTSTGSAKSLPSSQQATTQAVDIGQPRGAPQWAATAGDEGKGTGRPGDKEQLRATTGVILEALAGPGPAKVLAKAFERVIDVEEDDGDEASVANSGGAGDATRRVFDGVAWVYDHASCARVRALCPTRPSPIVIRRFILAQQGGDTRDRVAVANTAPTTKSKTPNSSAADDRQRNKTRADGGKNGGNTKTNMGAASEEGGTENGGGGRGRGGGEGGGGFSLASTAWLFSSLPFHDDDTFATFFGDVLQSSGRLARCFS